MRAEAETVERLRMYGPKGPLTQSEVAQLAGISQKQVSMIELGRIVRPRPETLRQLAFALGVEPERLMAACEESYRRAQGAGKPGAADVSHTPSVSDGGAG